MDKKMVELPKGPDDLMHYQSDDKSSDISSVMNKVDLQSSDQGENDFGENFETFDRIDSNDPQWQDETFREKIRNLGPDIFEKSKLAAKVEPFKLEWAFGFNRDATIINLCYGTTQKILFFNITQCGVLYDLVAKKMEFLQGHPNIITAISSTLNGNILATADSGPDNVIVIWQRSDMYISHDFSTNFLVGKLIFSTPLVTYFDPYNGKNILSVALSTKGNYLISIGEYGDDDIRIDLRIWANGKDEPNGTIFLNNYFGKVEKIKFSFMRENHFVVLFSRAVAFFTWDSETETLNEPVLPSIKFKGRLGTFTDITYVENCHEVMASTSEGCIVFFGSSLHYRDFDEKNISNDMITIKICKISKVGINTIDSADGVVITGSDKGVVNIFDKRLRLLFWYDQYLGKPIYSIRFIMMPRKYVLSNLCMNEVVHLKYGKDSFSDPFFNDLSDEFEVVYRDQLCNDASLIEERWVVRDFIVVDNEKVSYVNFVDSSHHILFQRGRDVVGAIAVHDELTYLVIGYKNGIIYLFNYMSGELRISHKLPESLDRYENPAEVNCMEYSTKALHLACGRSNGEMWMLDPVLLRPRQDVITVSDIAIEKIAFSDDNKQLAFCNERMTVYLMFYDVQQETWCFLGKIRSHYKKIVSMFFYSSGPKVLTTVGLDKYVITYNNVDISPGDEFEPTSKVRIDQIASPLSCELYPVKHYPSEFRYLLISDNQYKYKLINSVTQMCRSTTLGPAFGCYQNTPVTKIKLLPEHNDDYVIFMTKKHFGLQKLPLTGNPYSFVGCLGHPIELLDFKVSGDGDYVFTVGKNDMSVLRWKTQTKGVDLMQNLGGNNFEPFYCVIEGGKNGFLFQEMQDLFFYMQILHEGENSTLPRCVSDKLAISELPDLMRACGYFPTEFEIESLVIDIKYRDYDTDGTTRETASFLDFVKLYVNHKPVYGYSLSQMRTTFTTFTEAADYPVPDLIKKDDFLELLTLEGEPFTLSQLHKCMKLLMGAEESSQSGHYLFEFIPKKIDYETFVDDILGIDMTRDKIRMKGTKSKSGDERSISSTSSYNS